MKKKIYKFIDNDKKYVPLLAKEIVNIFKNEANKENVEYSFVIDGETKEIKRKDANTYFVFDTVEDTHIDNLKKSLFDKDLEDIEEKSVEEEKIMEDVRNFLLKVCKEITIKYKKDIEKTIRQVVLGNNFSSKQVPLNDIEVVSIDVADYTSIPSSYKYLLRIGKISGTEINSDEIIKFVQNRQELTGMDIDSIFSIEKQIENPLFENVMTIEATRKFLNEITIYFYVDYTVTTEKPSEKKLDKDKKNSYYK